MCVCLLCVCWLPVCVDFSACVGAVRFKCEFEEVYDYFLDFKDWGVFSTTSDPAVNDMTYNVTASAMSYQSGMGLLKDLSVQFFYKYPFRGRVPALVSPLSMILPTGGTPHVNKVTPALDPVFHSINVPCGAPDPSSTAITVHEMLHFGGTRSQLEDETLLFSIKERVHPLFQRRETYDTSASMQGVMDYGTLTAPLTVRYTEGPLDFLNPIKPTDDIGNKAVKCLCRTAFCCKSCFDEKAPMDGLELRGNVTFYKNKKPLHRQSGKASAERLVASPDDENFIKVKVFAAKGLHMLDGSYRDAMNPSISIEWNGLLRETSTLMDNASPEFKEILDFRVVNIENYVPPILTVQAWHNDGFCKSGVGVAFVNMQHLVKDMIENVKEEELTTKDPPAKLFKFEVRLDPPAVAKSSLAPEEKKDEEDMTEEEKTEAAEKKAALKDKQHGSIAAAPLTIQVWCMCARVLF